MINWQLVLFGTHPDSFKKRSLSSAERQTSHHLGYLSKKLKFLAHILITKFKSLK